MENHTNTTFSTEGLVANTQIRGSLTYETKEYGYTTYVTVNGNFQYLKPHDSHIGRIAYRKPRGKKWVHLCYRDAVVDFVEAVR